MTVRNDGWEGIKNALNWKRIYWRTISLFSIHCWGACSFLNWLLFLITLKLDTICESSINANPQYMYWIRKCFRIYFHEWFFEASLIGTSPFSVLPRTQKIHFSTYFCILNSQFIHSARTELKKNSELLSESYHHIMTIIITIHTDNLHGMKFTLYPSLSSSFMMSLQRKKTGQQWAHTRLAEQFLLIITIVSA